MIIFDGHADIWTDVTRKRQQGLKDVFKNNHLSKFKSGNIKGGIFVIWVDPPYDSNPDKRTLEIIENMSTEILSSQDVITIVKSADDFHKAMNSDKLAVIIGIEGLSSIGNNINWIDTFYMLGARHASLTWNEENQLATGVRGNPSRGLTEYGVKAVKRLEELGMIVDVSHANEKTFWDIYENTIKPFIASHSNCKALCDVPRNLTDSQLKAIAERGGLVGLNAFNDFVHLDREKQNIEHLANHIDHMVELMGIDHVAFGFDFCDYLAGDTMSSFASDDEVCTIGLEDASKAQNMIEILKGRGYTYKDLEKISYKNYTNLINEILK